MSIPPKRSYVRSTASATVLSSRTSPTIASACPPAASISAAALWIVPCRRGCGSAVFASSATLAPSRAARSAIARPMPRLPPVMNRVRALRLMPGPLPAIAAVPTVGGRDRPDRLDRVGLRGGLVVAVALDAGEPQGHPGRVAAARLDAVEGDLDDLLGAHVHRMGVAA